MNTPDTPAPRRRRATPTATVTLSRPNEIRADCSDGYTYFVAIFRHPKRRPKVNLGRWPTGTREPDKEIDRRRLPRAVKTLFLPLLLEKQRPEHHV
jgi:hypothetical protein